MPQKGPDLLFTVTTDLRYDQRMQRICRSLSQAGYRVLLVGRCLPGSPPLRSEPYRQKRLRCFFTRGAPFYAEYNLRLFFLLLVAKFRVGCAIDLDTILPMRLAAPLRGKTWGYDAHEYFTEMEEVVGRPRVRKAWEAIGRFCIPRAHFAYTVGEALAEILTERYGIPFQVIRNTAEKQPLPQVQQQSRQIIYVGAVNRGRGLEELLEVLPQVPARLLICGQGDVLASLKEKAEQLGLGDKVEFRGYVPPEELPELIAASHLGYLLLSQAGLSYYYSLANKFFDYVQAGVPLLCIDFPEYRKLNQEFEVADLVPLEKTAIKAGLLRLLQDENHYRKKRQAALQARQRWHWQAESQKLLSLYRQVVPPPQQAEQ